MNIVILSKNPESYSSRRLVESAQARGHSAAIINYLECYMSIVANRPQVFHRGRPLEGVDAVIPRVAASANFDGTAVIRQFEMAGAY